MERGRERENGGGGGKRGKSEGSARFASISFPKARNVGHPKISLRSASFTCSYYKK